MALTTPLTELFKIKHPVMLAGMAGAAGPELAAAVSNAGGLGNIGGVGFTPEALRKAIAMLKKELVDKNAPFGVDLLLPQVGGNARKTNKDYTGGTLPELVDIIIAEKAALFICAVGVPPKWAVDKFHQAGIPVMNMIGAVKHVNKALEAGVDIICAQGGEGGGHTGDVATAILLPKVVDAVRGKMSPLTGKPVQVVGAGGIFDGRGLAACLAMGCSGVWVGTRFIASDEAGAGPLHKQKVVQGDYADTVRTTIFTGRPMRVFKTPYIQDWEQNRTKEMHQLQESGLPAFVTDVNPEDLEGGFSVGLLQQAEVLTQEEKKKGLQHSKCTTCLGAPARSFNVTLRQQPIGSATKGNKITEAGAAIRPIAKTLSRKEARERGVFLTGQCAGAISDIKPAGQIVEEMVQGAVEQLQSASKFLVAKL